jgi:hypothetical protein
LLVFVDDALLARYSSVAAPTDRNTLLRSFNSCVWAPTSKNASANLQVQYCTAFGWTSKALVSSAGLIFSAPGEKVVEVDM